MTKVSEHFVNTLDEAGSKNYLKNFSKRMLKTQLFIGTFQEKRFVEPLKSYRDVVRIDGDEKDFIENILTVKRKIKEELRQDILKQPVWIGITDPDVIGAPVGYNLWVVMPVEVFGRYWFKVKTVEFLENEVRLMLDIVRPIKNDKSCSDSSVLEELSDFDLKIATQDFLNRVGNSSLYFIKNYMTLNNIKVALTFIFLLSGTILTAGVNMIQFLLEYLLKFMRELTSMIKAFTPIVTSFFNVIGRTIYGLLALWQNKPVYSPPIYNYYIDPNNIITSRNTDRLKRNFANTRGLPYRSANIVPLDDNP